MIIICAKLFSNQTTKFWAGHKQVLPMPMHKAEMRTVTLTFDLVTLFLLATHHLVIMIIFATLFSDPTNLDKVIGRTRIGFTVAYAQSLSAVTLTLHIVTCIFVYNTFFCHDGSFLPNNL